MAVWYLTAAPESLTHLDQTPSVPPQVALDQAEELVRSGTETASPLEIYQRLAE